MLYDEPQFSKFLAAVLRIKRRRERIAKQNKMTRQKLRSVLRKMRSP